MEHQRKSAPLIYILEVIAGLGLAFHLFGVARVWEILPDIIPIHFNFIGKADSFGNKTDLLLLFGLNLLMYLGLTWLSRNPEKLNLPWKINKATSEYQYALAAKFAIILKVQVVWLFAFVSWRMTYAAFDPSGGLGLFFVPLVIVVSIFTLIGYLFNSSGITE